MESRIKFVSIVIPVYNKGNYVAECLQSIERQVYRNFELILIDDGSTDNSGKICDDFCQSHSYAKVFHTSNNGVSCARNLGIDKAKGDYIVFIDSDDILGKYYLEVLIELMKKSDDSMAIIGHGIKGVNEICDSPNITNARLYEIDEIFNNLICNNQIRGYVWNKIFNKSIIDQYNIRFLPETKIWEDIYFVLNYMQHIQKGYFCKNIHYYYRRIPASSISSKQRFERIDIAKKIYEFKKEDCMQFHEATKSLYVDTIVTFCWSAFKDHTLSKEQKKYYLDKIKELKGFKYLDLSKIIKLFILLLF